MSIEQQVKELWDEIPARFRFITVDARGEICAYTHEPRRAGGTYIVEEGEYRVIERVKPRIFNRPEPILPAE